MATCMVLLLLSSLTAQSQSILSGAVTDQQGKPLAFATVALRKTDSTAAQLRQTDSLGRFVFRNIDKQGQLSVYALGYSRWNVQITEDTDSLLHIILQPLTGDLEGITVVGSKPLIERAADRVVFHVDRSIQSAGSNGLEVLTQAPGIRINDQAIALAGRGTLGIMLNGRLLHMSGKALLNYLRSFPAAQIASIEIIPHPGASYEAEGPGGLINIRTKKSSQAGLSGEASAGAKLFFYRNQPNYKGIKNYGDLDGSLGLYYNQNKWSLYTQASYTAGRELWGYGIDVYHPDKHWAMKDTGEYRIATLNVLAGADYSISPRTTIGFSYNYGYHMEEGADYVKVPVYNLNGHLDSNLKTVATYYPIAKSNAFNVHLNQALGASGALLTLNADYFNFYRHDRSDLITRSYDGEGKEFPDRSHALYDTALQNIRIYTFKADLTLPTPFAQFSAGGKASFINNYSNIFYYDKIDEELVLDESVSNEFRYIENTQALYANAAKTIDQWQLSAGLRAELTQTRAHSYFSGEVIKKSYLKLFPSVSATYRLNEDHQFSFNYGKRIHRPTFWNLNPYKTFMTAYTYVEGNPYLEPEYITNLQVAHQYKKRLTSALYMDVINNGFDRVIRAYEQGPYAHITGMENFIRSYRYGISETLSWQPFRWWENNTLAKGYYTRVHSDIADIRGITGWGLYVETGNTFYLNLEKTLSGYLGFWYQFPEIIGFGRSNAYYSVDVGMQWQPLDKRLSLALNYSDPFQSSASATHTTVDGIRSTYTNFQLNSQIRLSATWHFGRPATARKPTETGNAAERSRVN